MIPLQVSNLVRQYRKGHSSVILSRVAVIKYCHIDELSQCFKKNTCPCMFELKTSLNACSFYTVIFVLLLEE